MEAALLATFAKSRAAALDGGGGCGEATTISGIEAVPPVVPVEVDGEDAAQSKRRTKAARDAAAYDRAVRIDAALRSFAVVANTGGAASRPLYSFADEPYVMQQLRHVVGGRSLEAMRRDFYAQRVFAALERPRVLEGYARFVETQLARVRGDINDARFALRRMIIEGTGSGASAQYSLRVFPSTPTRKAARRTLAYAAGRYALPYVLALSARALDDRDGGSDDEARTVASELAREAVRGADDAAQARGAPRSVSIDFMRPLIDALNAGVAAAAGVLPERERRLRIVRQAFANEYTALQQRLQQQQDDDDDDDDAVDGPPAATLPPPQPPQPPQQQPRTPAMDAALVATLRRAERAGNVRAVLEQYYARAVVPAYNVRTLPLDAYTIGPRASDELAVHLAAQMHTGGGGGAAAPPLDGGRSARLASSASLDAIIAQLVTFRRVSEETTTLRSPEDAVPLLLMQLLGRGFAKAARNMVRDAAHYGLTFALVSNAIGVVASGRGTNTPATGAAVKAVLDEYFARHDNDDDKATKT